VATYTSTAHDMQPCELGTWSLSLAAFGAPCLANCPTTRRNQVNSAKHCKKLIIDTKIANSAICNNRQEPTATDKNYYQSKERAEEK